MYTSLADLLEKSGQQADPSLFQRSMTSAPEPASSSQSSTFVDVHTFDYTYANLHHDPVNMTLDQKRYWIEQLMNHLHPQARHGAHLILVNIGMEANRDTTNQKTAEDLLVLLAQHVLLKDKEFLPLVDEQLMDMVQLGQCAQGRTTRLWQLYSCIKK
jgi:hypothetical protein